MATDVHTAVTRSVSYTTHLTLPGLAASDYSNGKLQDLGDPLLNTIIILSLTKT